VKLNRRLRYYYLRFIRLRGEPHELALGMAFGVFTGVMPILPFQIALAVVLAMAFKASKITAALGTWISNPLNWYFLYLYSYKVGTVILGQSEHRAHFMGVMEAIEAGEKFTAVAGRALEAGGAFIAAFLIGGLALGLASAPLAYALFLPVFRRIASWRETRKTAKRLQVQLP